MAKIILNNEEFDFTNYNRTTYFSENTITGNGYIGGLKGTDLTTRLETLARNPITSLSIKTDDSRVIYSLNNINATINNMDENYDGVSDVNIGLNIQFN